MRVASKERRTIYRHDSIPAPPLVAPGCEDCGTGAYLIVEDYIPGVFTPDGHGLRPASVSYTCSNCGGFSAHDVPAIWTLPGWHWYA